MCLSARSGRRARSFLVPGYVLANDVAGKVACVAALGIAMFPMSLAGATGGAAIAGLVRSVATLTFFRALAYYALVLFAKTDPSRSPTGRKLQRN